MVALIFIALLIAAGIAGATGIGAADTRDVSWSLFPLTRRSDPQGHGTAHAG